MSTDDSNKYLKIIFGVWPVITGLLVITGWVSNSYILKRIIDSPIPMNPVTAVLFILLGIIIVTGHKKKLYFLINIAVLVISLLKLLDIFYGTSFQVDSYLFIGKLHDEPAFPNRIAPNSALNFFLIAVANIILMGTSKIRIVAGQLLLFIVTIISLFAFVGYIFNIRSFYGVGIFTPMALITSINFFVTSCGLLINKMREGLLRFIFNDGPSGEVAQYLLPASIVIPLVLGWLRLWGQREGYYDSEFGVALSVILNLIMLFSITCISSYFLYRTDMKRRLAEKELRFLASHDPLTGLTTRRVFMEQLNRRISLAQRREKDCYSVFYLDVDGLKQVNDQLGHQAGDDLLVNLALILKTCVRSSDSVTRLGGDEFIILFEEILEGSEVSLAERILKRMPATFSTEKGEVATGLSIGIVTPSKSETNADNIISAADEALYKAKKGKHGYIVSTKYS